MPTIVQTKVRSKEDEVLLKYAGEEAVQKQQEKRKADDERKQKEKEENRQEKARMKRAKNDAKLHKDRTLFGSSNSSSYSSYRGINGYGPRGTSSKVNTSNVVQLIGIALPIIALCVLLCTYLVKVKLGINLSFFVTILATLIFGVSVTFTVKRQKALSSACYVISIIVSLYSLFM